MGSSVLARGCDVPVLIASLGGEWALSCWRKGIRVPWLISDSKTRCLLWSGETGGGDSGGVLVSSRGAMVGTWPDGSATSCASIVVCGTGKGCQCADR